MEWPPPQPAYRVVRVRQKNFQKKEVTWFEVFLLSIISDSAEIPDQAVS